MNHAKLGRNDPCHCGSHRKYKHCCLRGDEDREFAQLNQSLEKSLAKVLEEDAPYFEDEDELDDRALPGFAFVASLSQTALWGLVPGVLLRAALKLREQRQRQESEAPTAYLTEKQLLTAVSSYGSPRQEIEAAFTEIRRKGPITPTCSCSEASYGGLCAHQVCLLLDIWDALHSKAESQFARELKSPAPLSAESTADLPQLESVILCMPTLLGFEAAFKQQLPGALTRIFSERQKEWAELLREIPAAKRPLNLKRKTLVKNIRSASAHDYPELFARPTGYFGHYSYGSDEQLKRIKQALEYRFTDGAVVGASQIMGHPYIRVVAEEFLPWIPNNRTREDSGSLFTHGSDYAPDFFKDAELAILRVLKAAALSGLKVILTDSSDSKKKRLGLWLREFSLRPPGLVRCILDCATLGTKQARLDWIVPSDLGIAALYGGFGLTEKGGFFLHSWLSEKERLLRDQYPLVSERRSSLFHESLSDLSRTLRGRHAQTAKIQLEVLPKTRQFSASEWTPGLDLRAGHGVDGADRNEVSAGFFFSVPGESWQSQGFPNSYQFVLAVLSRGLGGVSPLDNTELASRRRGDKRDRDLKILRHAGMGQVIAQATLRGLLAGEAPARVRADLDLKLGLLVSHWEGGIADGAPKMSKLCSKAVNDLLEGWIERCAQLLQEDELSIFPRAGEARLQGVFRRFAQFVLAWVDALALETRGECFVKERSVYQACFESARAGLGIHVSPDDDLSEGVSIFPYRLQDSRMTPGFAMRAMLPLAESGFRVLLEGIPIEELEPQDFRPEFSLSEKSIDWFELDPRFFFKGVEISAEQAEKIAHDGLIEFKGRIYLLKNRHLPSLKRLEEFWERIRAGQSKKTERASKWSEGSIVLLPRSQALELLALRASGVKVEGGPRWKEICEFYDRLGEKRELEPLQGDVRAELKKYQHIGVQWLSDLYRLGLGGILADDMGLGKTLQTLAFLEGLRIRGQLGSTLIVVPTSLTYNWRSECARFTPSLPLMVFQSKQKEELARFVRDNPQGVIVCTYGLFTEHQEFLAQFNWNIQVFDEAQNLKNIASKRAAASRSLPARFKLCLTGTPLENHLGEFYSLMDLVVPGCLGRLDEFRARYVTPDVLDRDAVQYLKLKSSPLVLRRHKSELLSELPGKTETTIKIPFEAQQGKLYRDIAVSWNDKVKQAILAQGESRSQLVMLTALLRLRQACSDPGSVPGVKYLPTPPKIEVLMEALGEIIESGESALVFTQFLHTFGRIEKALTKAGIQVFSLNGSTSRKDREKALGDFKESKSGSVMLMTLKTGGVGLNLTKASYVFHLEPWWNPAVENQATDRAHRIGQENSVQVYRYLIRDSVEEKIEVLKERKSARFNALFAEAESEQEMESGGALLTQGDFEYLLG